MRGLFLVTLALAAVATLVEWQVIKLPLPHPAQHEVIAPWHPAAPFFTQAPQVRVVCSCQCVLALFAAPNDTLQLFSHSADAALHTSSGPAGCEAV